MGELRIKIPNRPESPTGNRRIDLAIKLASDAVRSRSVDQLSKAHRELTWELEAWRHQEHMLEQAKICADAIEPLWPDIVISRESSPECCGTCCDSLKVIMVGFDEGVDYEAYSSARKPLREAIANLRWHDVDGQDDREQGPLFCDCYVESTRIHVNPSDVLVARGNDAKLSAYMGACEEHWNG